MESEDKTVKQLIEELKETGIMSVIDNGVSIHDTDFKILYQNQTAKDLLGDHVGKYCYKSYMCRALACDDCSLRQGFSDGNSYKTEKSVATDKGVLHLEITVAPLRDSKENIIAGIEVLKDITDRKKTGEALKYSEKKYRNLVDNAIVGIYKSNLKGDILYVNRTMLTMCGFDSQEEMISGGVLRGYKDPKKRDIMIDMLKAHGKIADFEIEILTKQGETKTMLLNASLDGDEISGMLLDITERKQAEQLLLDEQEKYCFIMSGLSDGIIGIDKRTKEFVFANKALCKMLGYSKDELLSLGIPNLHRAEDLPYVIEEFDAMASGKKDSCFRMPFLTKSGNTIYVDISATHPGNEILYGFLRDVTDRRRLEEELFQANSLLELRVLKRTEKLKAANEKLRSEIEERKKAENELLKVHTQLLIQAEELREANAALKVLLRQREKDKSDFEENILSNIKHLVMPNILKLKNKKRLKQDLSLLNLLESNLNSIISPFSRKMLSKYIMLTPREIEVADLIREGKQDKDNAELLNISLETVKSHRQHIRRKLSIYGKKINLRTHLLSISE